MFWVNIKIYYFQFYYILCLHIYDVQLNGAVLRCSMKVQIRACELLDVEELLSSIQVLLSRICTFDYSSSSSSSLSSTSTSYAPTITLLLSSFPFTAFTFANNFNVLICIVEYDGACPSSDFPLVGPP